MTEPARVDDWIRTEIARQLAAVNACAAGWDQPTQTRFLRLLVERGLEKIDATEGEYYDFMTQCALLAGENMQDARLQVLEQQVDELRNPPFSLAETLLDAALIMMGEVIIAGTAYYAVPALFALAFSAKLRRLRDEVATASRFSHRMAEAVDEIERKLAGDTQVARGLLQRMGELGPDGWAESLQLRKDVQAIKQSIAQGRDHLRVVEEARTESEDLAEAAHEAFERAQGELSAPLDTLLKGVLGHTVVGRVGEESGEELSRVSLDLLSQADGAPRPSFETSGMVGDFLAAIQKERRASRDAWAELRLHVRFVDDEHFHASEKVQGASSSPPPATPGSPPRRRSRPRSAPPSSSASRRCCGAPGSPTTTCWGSFPSRSAATRRGCTTRGRCSTATWSRSTTRTRGWTAPAPTWTATTTRAPSG